MSPRTEKQFEEIRNSKKELIINSALKEFAEHGYHATSISEISKKAKISKGLIYNYFESKEELLKAVIHNGLDVMTKLFDPNKKIPFEEDDFEYIIEQLFSTLQKERNFWKLYFSLLVNTEIEKMVSAPIKKYIEPFIMRISEYYTKKAYENPIENALIFGAMLDGISINYILHPEMFQVEKIKKILIQKFK